MSENGRGPNSVDKRRPLALGLVGGAYWYIPHSN